MFLYLDLFACDANKDSQTNPEHFKEFGFVNWIKAAMDTSHIGITFYCMRKKHTSFAANFTTYCRFCFPRVVIISTLLVPEVKLVLTAPHYTRTRIITPAPYWFVINLVDINPRWENVYEVPCWGIPDQTVIFALFIDCAGDYENQRRIIAE